jgi:hypothetical protein
VQYTWHLPKDHAEYSVYIVEEDVRRGNASVEERLRRIRPDAVERMRGAVVRLIPMMQRQRSADNIRLIYKLHGQVVQIN